MIKLSGSRFTDIMPENLASQAEVQAIAYAVGRQVEKLCAYSDAARTYAAIATMPEWLLDYMAVELRLSLIHIWPAAGPRLVPRSRGGGGTPGQDRQDQRQFRLQHIPGHCGRQHGRHGVHRSKDRQGKAGRKLQPRGGILAQGGGG